MPESPEVQALADHLRERSAGRAVARVEVAAFQALKTFDPPPTALHGRTVTDVTRHGKFLDLDADGLHLVLHLARAGWIRRQESMPATPPKPGRGPLALRLLLDDGSGWQVTEQGTTKRLAAYVVRDPAEVPGIARLGPDPLADGFSRDDLAAVAAGRGVRLKGLLTDQSLLAGVGNAYSDEVLHTARLSPYAIAAKLDDEQLDRLYEALRSVLRDALERARGLAAGELKAEKKAGLRVHGRAGEPCPVCGDTVRQVVFAESSLQYCPTCQTRGRVLADRRLSRLLK
ncbi:Fpg/Nei family DNA glycosylase [Peterkaempfera bronchialis]|uniref:Fpg/Nei family DNA glycosylase n=1 Tax=Peterkaempfera bronchialis TaxID=2126346 RepID=A0A345SZD8_9ACTN|nr:DNA-formamidopyrimidine glycosylase family protein [Peterkaempfera bronchialis]AXI79093.1 Fpg/Nei family DNA glycosylase [Peterkaempfera bronchialis]